MAVHFTGCRSKMGYEVRLYLDDETRLTVARDLEGRMLAIDTDRDVAFWRGWALLSTLRPLPVVRNRFGRYRFVTSSFVPDYAKHVSVSYPTSGGARVKFDV